MSTLVLVEAVTSLGPLRDGVIDNVSDGHVLHQERFGKGLVWRLYSNGVLEISGYGRMPDYINHRLSYTGEGQAPWIGCDRYGVMPNIFFQYLKA